MIIGVTHDQDGRVVQRLSASTDDIENVFSSSYA
jgi:hypothetical protein